MKALNVALCVSAGDDIELVLSRVSIMFYWTKA
jgi:hypothetical protein